MMFEGNFKSMYIHTSFETLPVHSQQSVAEWSSRHAREQWERQVCETVINPILQVSSQGSHRSVLAVLLWLDYGCWLIDIFGKFALHTKKCVTC